MPAMTLAIDRYPEWIIWKGTSLTSDGQNPVYYIKHSWVDEYAHLFLIFPSLSSFLNVDWAVNDDSRLQKHVRVKALSLLSLKSSWGYHPCFQGDLNITSPSLPSYGAVSLSTSLISLIQVIQFHVSYTSQTPFPSDPWCLLHPASFQPRSLCTSPTQFNLKVADWGREKPSLAPATWLG